MKTAHQATSDVRSFSFGQDGCLLILRFATSALFAGRAWLYLMKMGPLSTFFWHQDWLEGPLQNWFGLPWVDYAAYSEPFIQSVQSIMGGLFALCAVACWWVRPGRAWANGLVGAGMVMLLPFWLLRWVDQDYQWPMMFEHFLQWGTPLLLILYRRMPLRAWCWVGAIFCAATFAGHGMYALGWTVPRSNDFINLTQAILPLSETDAVRFLIVAGALDFVAAAMLFMPSLRVAGFAYMGFWGLLTALARLFAHVTPAEKYYGLHPWLAETIVRLPHGLVPCALALATVLVLYKTQDAAVHARLTPVFPESLASKL